MKKFYLSLLCIVFGAVSLQAQSIGVGYAYSSTAPNSGYTAHFESSLFSIGVASINLRLRATYFSDTDLKVNSVDLGESYVLAGDGSVLAKVSILPLVNPYAGLGIAYEQSAYNLNVMGTTSKKETTEYPIYGTIGVEFSPIPFIKPFAEYRFRAGSLKDVKASALDSDRGIFAVGVALSF